MTGKVEGPDREEMLLWAQLMLILLDWYLKSRGLG